MGESVTRGTNEIVVSLLAYQYSRRGGGGGGGGGTRVPSIGIQTHPQKLVPSIGKKKSGGFHLASGGISPTGTCKRTKLVPSMGGGETKQKTRVHKRRVCLPFGARRISTRLDSISTRDRGRARASASTPTTFTPNPTAAAIWASVLLVSFGTLPYRGDGSVDPCGDGGPFVCPRRRLYRRGHRNHHRLLPMTLPSLPVVIGELGFGIRDAVSIYSPLIDSALGR